MCLYTNFTVSLSVPDLLVDTDKVDGATLPTSLPSQGLQVTPSQEDIIEVTENEILNSAVHTQSAGNKEEESNVPVTDLDADDDQMPQTTVPSISVTQHEHQVSMLDIKKRNV